MNEKVIESWDRLEDELKRLRARGQKVVFTNGCFDLLHVGHVRYLRAARRLGDLLLVALNTDRSVRKLKGPTRPVQPQGDRAEILAALECVDLVTFFDEPTPLRLIERMLPDVLVKGGDWPVDRIVGREAVEAAGGRVVTLPYVPGVSTSELIERIRRTGASAPA